jgi:predicted CxxxxCH...CXXCH cytochrome family protein
MNKLLIKSTKAFTLLASILIFSSCLDSRTSTESIYDNEDGCRVCHSLSDNMHTAHLAEKMNYGSTLKCRDCHMLNKEWFESKHMNNSIDVDFGMSELAATEDEKPHFNGKKCTNIYCHGSTLSGGSNTKPYWKESEKIECGTCHSLPPTVDHPDSNDCQDCHESAFTNGELNENHINGIID